MKHVNKFGMFVRKNTKMPYFLKAKVLDAALMSSMLYGCEAWVTNNLAAVTKHYNTALKLLLGVRTTTINALCLIESGRPELASIIMKKRCTFIRKFIKNTSGDEPLSRVLTICRSANTKMYQMLMYANDYVGDPESHSLDRVRNQCIARRNISSKIETYLDMNPELSMHSMYYSPTVAVPDYLRVSFTRFRLSAHRLRVETGRWARTPREQRVCKCDNRSLQDERHVLFICKHTANLRMDYEIMRHNNSWTNFYNAESHINLCTVIHKLLEIYT